MTEEGTLEEKQTLFSSERFGYTMFQLIGIVMFAIAVTRFYGELTRDTLWMNVLLLALGLLFFGGASWSSLLKQPSAEELRWLKQKEMDQVALEDGGFATSVIEKSKRYNELRQRKVDE
jgi:hypothetical protein